MCVAYKGTSGAPSGGDSRREKLSTAALLGESRLVQVARPMGAALADAIADGQSRSVVSFAVCVVGKRVWCGQRGLVLNFLLIY